MIHSEIKIGGNVAFPDNKKERVYMHPFFQKEGLPVHLFRWQKTVDQMLVGINTNNPIYLMIDQGFVNKGQSQRRPGLHVEGNWNNPLRMHRVPRHGHDDYSTEMIILASDVIGCRALSGDFVGAPSSGGQCNHINVTKAKEHIFEPFKIYKGNVTMIHESLPLQYNSHRTLVRLNIPEMSL